MASCSPWADRLHSTAVRRVELFASVYRIADFVVPFSSSDKKFSSGEISCGVLCEALTLTGLEMTYTKDMCN